MKVILKQDVAKVGKKGDLIEVSDGYGRNFLVGRGMAVEATPGKIKDHEEQQKISAAKDEKRKKAAVELKKKIGGKAVVVKVNAAGEGGKIFGSVTSAQVADAITAQFGVEVDKKDVKLDDVVKQTGSYAFKVKLYPGVDAEMTLKAEAE